MIVLQVCLLGSGSIIGDMSVREGAGGPPKRSATVVALTELVTYKVPLKEFKRRMPVEVLEVGGDCWQNHECLWCPMAMAKDSGCNCQSCGDKSEVNTND